MLSSRADAYLKMQVCRKQSTGVRSLLFNTHSRGRERPGAGCYGGEAETGKHLRSDPSTAANGATPGKHTLAP